MQGSFVPFLLGAVLLSCPAWALDVTAVGQTVPKGKTGILQADLTCASPTIGVFLENHATLDLNGHVIDGCTVTAASASHTDPQRIAVRGPGVIRNATYGISLRAGTVRVTDVAIENSTSVGILGSGDFGDGPSTAKLTRVDVSGSGSAAIQATRVVAADVSVTGNGSALANPAIVGWDGVAGRRLTVTGNASGVFAADGQVKIADSQITGNDSIGVQGFRVSLSHSTVTGNTTVGPPSEADLVSSYAPRVKATTCGSSLKADGTASWGVCAGN